MIIKSVRIPPLGPIPPSQHLIEKLNVVFQHLQDKMEYRLRCSFINVSGWKSFPRSLSTLSEISIDDASRTVKCLCNV